MQIAGRHGALRNLVQIGKRYHTAQGNKQRLVAKTARRTYFHHQIGHFPQNTPIKFQHFFHMLTQSLADRFRAVHSQTDIFVIIDLYISDSAPFQLADHLLREKIRHLFLPKIGKNTIFVPNENAVARVHPILSPRNRRALGHVFELVPHAGFHAVFFCQSDEFFKAAGEAFPVCDPISEIVAPLFGVGIPPGRL